MQKNSLLKKKLVVVILVLFFGTCLVSALDIDSENEIVAKKISQLDLNDGLVGYWSFDFENAEDESINNNHGTVYGATPTDGISGRAFLFDGIDDYIMVPDSPSLDITQEVTLSVWVILDTIVTDEPPVFVYKRGDGADADEVYKLGVDSYGVGLVDFRINSDPVEGGSLLLSKWHHVVGTFDGSVKKIFLDGVQVVDETHVATIQTSSRHLYIGVDQDIWNMNQFLDGIIDEVRIYSRALTKDEVEYLYNNPGGLKTTIMFGRVSNLNTDVGNLMMFEALRLRCIQFSPFRFVILKTGENIKISEDYKGFLYPNILFGIFKSNI
jgi:hypothetical protein